MITEHDKEMFTSGACHILADELSQATGWPVWTLWHRGWYDAHALVRMPSGLLLDVSGPHTDGEVLKRWSWGPSDTLVEVPVGTELGWDSGYSERRARRRAQLIAPVLIERHHKPLGRP